MKLSSLFLFALLISLCPPARAADATHDFGRWEKEISAFEQIDRTNPPPKGAWLFVGSSTVRLWKSLPDDFPGQHVINRGFGGSEIIDSTHFAARIIFPYQPAKIFLRAGGNDLWAGQSPEAVFQTYQDFVSKISARLPEADIIFISWSPSIARWQQADKENALNKMVEHFVRGKPHLKYLDAWSVPLDADGKPRPELFLPDKLHFNADGYKLLAARVRAAGFQ